MTSTLSSERVRAFVPPPLPPNPQTLDLASLQAILAEANQAIGRLDGTTSSLPDLKLFLYSYFRKEAVLSSQIERTQSSLNTEFNPTDSLDRLGSYTGEESHLFDIPQRSLHIRAQDALVLHILLFEDHHPFFKTKRIRDPGDVNFLRP